MSFDSKNFFEVRVIPLIYLCHFSLWWIPLKLKEPVCTVGIQYDQSLAYSWNTLGLILHYIILVLGKSLQCFFGCPSLITCKFFIQHAPVNVVRSYTKDMPLYHWLWVLMSTSAMLIKSVRFRISRLLTRSSQFFLRIRLRARLWRYFGSWSACGQVSMIRNHRSGYREPLSCVS